MPAGAASLFEFLEMRQRLELSSSGREAWAYKGMADFVLQEGRAYQVAPLPPDTRRGLIKQCFRNAFELTMRRHDLVYVEGYAMGIIPVLHAWCADGDGRVIDPTWADDLGSAYFGVPFDRDFVLKAVAEKGSFGLIDDMQRSWPLLRNGGVNGWKHTESGPLPRP